MAHHTSHDKVCVFMSECWSVNYVGMCVNSVRMYKFLDHGTVCVSLRINMFLCLFIWTCVCICSVRARMCVCI